MKRATLATLMLFLFAFAESCPAAVIIVGPIPDYDHTEFPTLSRVLHTGFRTSVPVDIQGPDDASFEVDFRDRIEARIVLTVPVFAASYFSVDLPGGWTVTPPTFGEANAFFSSAAPATVIDVWAARRPSIGGAALPSPMGSPGLFLEGFDPVNPQFVPLSQEIFIGRSGTEYPTNADAYTVADLPSLMPGFDLTPFVGAAPTGRIYFAKREMPIHELGVLVPEPSSMIVFSLGASLIATLRRFQRTNVGGSCNKVAGDNGA